MSTVIIAAPTGSTAVTGIESVTPVVTTDMPDGGATVTKQCTVTGCTRPHKAGGFCLMHYRRNQRTGDPAKAYRGGRRYDKYAEIVDSLFPEWSSRTKARYAKAWRLMDYVVSVGGIKFTDLIHKVARPNGSIPVDDLLQRAEDIAAMHIARTELMEKTSP